MQHNNPPISVLAEKALYIFDMDGTIYLGGRVFDFAIRLIRHLRANGKQVLFFTNNASHSTAFYLQKLNRLGFEVREGEVMTSGDVTAEFLLRHRTGKSVYLIGTEELEEDLRKKEIPLIDGGAERADILLASFDLSLTYEKLNNGCKFLAKGAEFLATHPDKVCPVENGFLPDCGATVAYFHSIFGIQPTYFGKPYRETIEMICQVAGVPREKMCIFGDRLYTDIAMGKRNGVTAVMVLTGEATLEDLESIDSADHPDFIFPSLDEVDQALF